MNITQELTSADQDSTKAVARRLSKRFATEYRDLVLKATAALRAAMKLGIASPDGRIPVVESLVSSDAVTDEEKSSRQQVWTGILYQHDNQYHHRRSKSPSAFPIPILVHADDPAANRIRWRHPGEHERVHPLHI